MRLHAFVACVKLTENSVLACNTFALVALPLIFDFHSVSIAFKTDLVFPSLASISRLVPPVVLTFVYVWQ